MGPICWCVIVRLAVEKGGTVEVIFCLTFKKGPSCLMCYTNVTPFTRCWPDCDVLWGKYWRREDHTLMLRLVKPSFSNLIFTSSNQCWTIRQSWFLSHAISPTPSLFFIIIRNRHMQTYIVSLAQLLDSRKFIAKHTKNYFILENHLHNTYSSRKIHASKPCIIAKITCMFRNKYPNTFKLHIIRTHNHLFNLLPHNHIFVFL